MRTKRNVAIGLAFVACILSSACGPEDQSQSKSKSVLATTDLELSEAYQKNEIAARQKYDGYVLDVTGVVTNVTSDLNDAPRVDLRGANTVLPVTADFDANYQSWAAKLSRGDNVSIECQSITSVMQSPTLEDCAPNDENREAKAVDSNSSNDDSSERESTESQSNQTSHDSGFEGATSSGLLGPPNFRHHEPYGEVRSAMLASGWKPFHSKDADECASDDRRCLGRPEMEACAGTGLGNCRFLWKKHGKTVGICTIDDDVTDEAIFENICS